MPGKILPLMQRVFPALMLLLGFCPPVIATPYLWQTNSSSNDIHIYNLDNFQLVRRLEVGANPHGLAVPRSNDIVYLSLERYGREHGQLLRINPSNLEIERRMETCEGPQNIAVTPDGKWIYVPCKDGYYSVVDAGTGKTVKRIQTGGRPHNVKASGDGRYMYLSPLGNPRAVTVVDVPAGHQVVGTLPFGGQVRPLALSTDDRFLFQQVDGVNGFRVADTARREVINTVRNKASLGWYRPAQVLVNRVAKYLGLDDVYQIAHCHGIGVRPDGKEIWDTCGNNLTIHGLDGDHFPEVAQLKLSGTGYWLSFSPDSRLAAVALSDKDQVAVVDCNRKIILRLLDVGHGPKRNMILDY